jgi:RND superfamily putative drug exporter
MSKLLYRLGHVAVRRRRSVLAVWVALLVGVGVLAGSVGGETSDEFSVPGTESQRAMDLLQARFPSHSGSAARVVFASGDGSALTDVANRRIIDDTLADMAEAPGVVGVASPFDTGTLSPDGAVAFADVHYAETAMEVDPDDVEALTATAGPARAAGLVVEFGGEVQQHEEVGHTSELVGLAVAVIVLLFSFGSVVAMGLPLASALIGVGIGLSGITVLAGFTELSSTAPILATMIGLAVGIDYALFIVTRHRQNLAEGHSVEEAAARANATAGGAVVFAGVTVVIALAALAVIGIPFLTVMGLGAAFTVFLAVLIAITLLPALLGFAGSNIDRWRIGRSRTGSMEESHQTLSARWARGVIARPGAALVGGLFVMLVLAVPALDMRLGMPDAGTAPTSSTRRQAYDLLAEGFGPGFNGPMSAVVDLGHVEGGTDGVQAVSEALAADPGVLRVGEPVINEAGDTAIVPIIPRTSPASSETEDLVHRLRGEVLPPVAQSTGTSVALTGQTAVLIDLSDKMGAALPVFMAIVIGLTMILLLAVFRSLVVPVKAAIAILLSIASAFGVVVAIFQWGWLAGLMGVEDTVPIISFLPMLMFAILFGLSMDYEVFILSRVREDYVRTGQARPSVVSGLTSSARVITAAALIMISVFASFILGDDPTIKMMGLGFSVAVLLDATVVRMMIVPAVMALFGDRAWWLPAWLDRFLPNLDVEGEHLIEQLDQQELDALVASDPTAEAIPADASA